jgi:WD repeat-containing protein 48
VAGRCVATYNTRDNESIWSLFSEDPHLRCFYAGSKNGLVTKHWLDNDDTEAMVVPILRETSGINKVIEV